MYLFLRGACAIDISIVQTAVTQPINFTLYHCIAQFI
jgi:hypothetical protein